MVVRPIGLRRALLDRDATYAALAARIGASEAHVARVMAGQTRPSSIFMAACSLALGVPVDELFPPIYLQDRRPNMGEAMSA
jgi:transcriptional regulator with XRE-family HTH domain